MQETMTLPVGSRLAQGRYSVGRRLGQGGFGITYQGADTLLQRPVAIKEFFPSGSLRSPAGLQPPTDWQWQDFQRYKNRFLDEARALARFRHAGIVGVLDVFEANGTAYMVMEFLTGETLGSRLLKMRMLPPGEVLQLAKQLGEALAAVHAEQLLHRDLKPDNIFLASDGRVVLIDFGAARRYVPGQRVHQTAILTPGFAPLEQHQSDSSFGPSLDLYALGATLYTLLMGFPPPPSDERHLAHAQVPPLPPHVPATLRVAVEKSLALQPQARPQSVAEFFGLLGHAGAPGPQAPPPPPVPTYRVEPDGRGDFRSLAGALEGVPGGSKIVLSPGTYQIPHLLTIDRPLHLEGAGMDQTVIAGACDAGLIYIDCAGPVALHSLTLRRTGGPGHVLVQAKGDLELWRCRVEGARRHKAGADGVLIGGQSYAYLEDCQLLGNEIGLEVETQGRAEVEVSLIAGNDCGVKLVSQGALKIVDSRVAQNRIGILCEGESVGQLEQNTCVQNQENGISIGVQAKVDVLSNVCSGNGRHGIGYFSVSAGKVAGNTIQNNSGSGIAIGRGAQPQVGQNLCQGNLGGDITRF